MKKCARCKKEKPDLRTIHIDCFYNLKEAISEMETSEYFVEIPEKMSCFGTTRYYPKGTRDVHKTEKIEENKFVITTTQKPIKKIRLLEKKHYTIRVCKHCRAEFMVALREWFYNYEDEEDDD